MDVGSGVWVSGCAVAVASIVGVVVGTVVGVVLGSGVAVGGGVAVGALAAEATNGPPKTLTAFVCACPPEAFTESPRTEVEPFGTNFGTFTLMLALPVLLVTTWAIWYQPVPF